MIFANFISIMRSTEETRVSKDVAPEVALPYRDLQWQDLSPSTSLCFGRTSASSGCRLGLLGGWLVARPGEGW